MIHVAGELQLSNACSVLQRDLVADFGPEGIADVFRFALLVENQTTKVFSHANCGTVDVGAVKRAPAALDGVARIRVRGTPMARV